MGCVQTTNNSSIDTFIDDDTFIVEYIDSTIKVSSSKNEPTQPSKLQTLSLLPTNHYSMELQTALKMCRQIFHSIGQKHIWLCINSNESNSSSKYLQMMTQESINDYYNISYSDIENIDYNHNCIFISLDDVKAIDGRILWNIVQRKCTVVIWASFMPSILHVRPDSDFWGVFHILDCKLFSKLDIQKSGIILKI